MPNKIEDTLFGLKITCDRYYEGPNKCEFISENLLILLYGMLCFTNGPTLAGGINHLSIYLYADLFSIITPSWIQLRHIYIG